MPLNTVAEIKVSFVNSAPGYHPEIRGCIGAFNALHDAWDTNEIDLCDTTSTKVLLLSRSSKLIGIYNLSAQGYFESYLDKRVLFAAALKANALSIMLARRYPSGSIGPTEDDVCFYDEVWELGDKLGVPLNDYLIYNRDQFFSFCEHRAYEKNHHGKSFTMHSFDLPFTL